jgi:CheY-like chemotaxis protein
MTRLPTAMAGPSLARRVLLVEDNEATCKGMARLLEAYGFEVTTVYNGASALKALAADIPPDFLLTDMQLPDLDGREVARQARQLTPPPRVALITGWEFEPGDADLSAWGIDWVLIKPIDIQTLVAKLRQTAETFVPPHDPTG